MLGDNHHKQQLVHHSDSLRDNQVEDNLEEGSHGHNHQSSNQQQEAFHSCKEGSRHTLGEEEVGRSHHGEVQRIVCVERRV